jgi:hypothetical protein
MANYIVESFCIFLIGFKISIKFLAFSVSSQILNDKVQGSMCIFWKFKA